MKTTMIYGLAVSVCVCLAVDASAVQLPNPPEKPKTALFTASSIDYENIEEELQNYLQMDFDVVKAGFAIGLSEYDVDYNTKELITMLNTDESPNVRIAAGFSLLRLNDHNGMQAVIDVINTDPDLHVSSVLKILFFRRIEALSGE